MPPICNFLKQLCLFISSNGSPLLLPEDPGKTRGCFNTDRCYICTPKQHFGIEFNASHSHSIHAVI